MLCLQMPVAAATRAGKTPLLEAVTEIVFQSTNANQWYVNKGEKINLSL